MRGIEKKKPWNMKVTIIPIVIGTLGTYTKRLLKGLEDFENKRTSGHHPSYYIIENGQNTEKSTGNMQSLKLQRETLS